MKRVFSHIGFSAAITLLVLNLISTKYILIVLIGLATLFVASLLLPHFRKNLVLPLCFGTAVLFTFVFMFTMNNTVLPQKSLDEKTANATFYAVSEVENEDNYNYCTVKTTSIDYPNAPQNIKLTLYFESDEDITPYEELSGNLDFSFTYDDAFSSYGDWADGIYLSASSSDIKTTGKKITSPYSYILDLRTNIKNKLVSIIGDDEGALSVALVTGDKSNISSNVKSYFTSSGTSHIMAISGLHLSLIVGVFLFILKKLRLNQKLSSFLSIALTLFYMALANFSGSVVRAGIMMIVLLLSNVFSMRADTQNSLGLSVFLLSLNPFSVTDIGTTYSVIAVLALVTLYPRFMSKFSFDYIDPLFKTRKEKLRDFLYETTSVVFSSLAVFVLSIPISYFYFNSAVVISPVSNIIAMPLGSACVIMSVITYIVSLLNISPLTIMCAFVTKCLDKALIFVTKTFSNLGSTSIPFDYRFGLILAFIMLMVAIMIIINKKKATQIISCLCATLLALSLVSFDVMDKDVAKIHIYQYNAVICEYKNKVIVFGVNTASEYYNVSSYLSRNNENIDILICDSTSVYSAMLSNNESVNILICDEFNDTILENATYNILEVQNTYSLTVDENYSLNYDYGDVTININGFVIGSKSPCDILVSSKSTIDKNGKIDLSQGAITYRIKDKDNFSVRRINQWQK